MELNQSCFQNIHIARSRRQPSSLVPDNKGAILCVSLNQRAQIGNICVLLLQGAWLSNCFLSLLVKDVHVSHVECNLHFVTHLEVCARVNTSYIVIASTL